MKPFQSLLLLLLLLLIPAAAVAQVPPDARWRTLETEHFRVTYEDGLEPLARRAAGFGEAAWARLAAELTREPAGKVDMVLTDAVDQSNGSATPLPSNRIVLYARPPVDVQGLDFFEDWMEELVTHELTHIFHLDRAAGPSGVLRRVFGRVPLSWPFFPAFGTPGWSIEGLATMVESRFTGAGRVYGTHHDMILRAATLEDRFASIDQIHGNGPTWPAGGSRYIYGAAFFEHLARKHGPEAHGRLIEGTAGAWIPPSLAFDRVARKAIDESFSDAYRDWTVSLREEYGQLADSLRAEGLTLSERLTRDGYRKASPRVSRDGRIAYAASDGRSVSVTRVLDPETGAATVVGRRNGLGPIAWMPDGVDLVTAQLEYDGPDRVFSDLYRIGPGGERRLTRGARLEHPDVAADGRTVIAVRGAGGTNGLVLVDLTSGEPRALLEPEPGVYWAYPRWSPDGSRIAAGRWREGDYDVVVLDRDGRLLQALSADPAVDTSPAWSPDGRWILFSSDRSGISNLYAWDTSPATVDGERLFQVTNVLTGAFFPDVSADGRWVVFAGYHAGGYDLERIPFDPAAWRDPAPVRPELLAHRLAAKAGAPEIETPVVVGPRPYSPANSLLPRYWLPVLYGDTIDGFFLGVQTGGQDLVGRHAFGTALAVRPADGRWAGGFDYRYAGFGNPVLGLSAERSQERLSLGPPPAGAPDARILSTEDAFALSTTLRRRRWRSSASATLGVDYVMERRSLADAPGYTLTHAGTDLFGLSASTGFSNTRSYPFSISREDGVAVSGGLRQRWDLEAGEAAQRPDRGFREAWGQLALYDGFPVAGFSHHVIAARAAGRWREGPGASTIGLGGASGDPLSFLSQELASGRRFLPVRGFDADARRGTRGWAASLEYRFPLLLVGRGFRLWPFFLDRISGAAFLDAGDAWCAADQFAAGLRCAASPGRPLAATGAEISIDAGFFSTIPVRFRFGTGLPISGSPSGRPVPYFQIGPSF